MRVTAAAAEQTAQGGRPSTSGGLARGEGMGGATQVPRGGANPPAHHPDGDPLSAARGIIIGIPVGLALWGALALVWWLA